MDGSGFCEAPHLAAAQCAGGEGDGGQRDAAAGGDTAAGHLPWRTAARGGRWQRRPSRLASGWRMRKARRGLCLASSSAARVQGAARGRLARRLARRARRAIVSLQSAARRARAYAVSRVPPRWCSVWRAPKPRAHSPQAALSRAPRMRPQSSCSTSRVAGRRSQAATKLVAAAQESGRPCGGCASCAG